RYPSLARRVQAQQEKRGAVPHAPLVFGGAIVVAVALFLGHVGGARDRGKAALALMREQQVQYYREQRRVRVTGGHFKSPPRPRSETPAARPPGGAR
ncbi:MAG: hypothetical protein B7Z72_13895, partial [Gemmatimonadetes bacterium 21-71-4]